MPFGLQGALAVFMQLINEVLHEHLYQGVLVYLDDILIYTKKMAQHTQLVQAGLVESVGCQPLREIVKVRIPLDLVRLPGILCFWYRSRNGSYKGPSSPGLSGSNNTQAVAMFPRLRKFLPPIYTFVRQGGLAI